MKKILFYSICAIALVACKKEVKNEQPVAGGAPASFNVFSPETKTTIDGLHVYWSAGDQIRVYGHNTSTDTYTDNGTYTLSSGAGTSAGVFTKDSGGTLTGDYDEYYAIYPGNLTATINGTTILLPRLNITSSSHLREQNPAAGQVDPKLAIMTAKYDGSKLVFHHGVGYIKVTIPTAGITQIDIDFQNNCLADTPTYNATTGALSSAGNSSTHVSSISGTFTQGASYYFAAIPRSGYSIGTTTVTFTVGGSSSIVTTDHFSGKSIEVGKVFDLGTPAATTDPYFTAADVEIEAGDTAGSITYTVGNPVVGGVVTANVLLGGTIGNLVLGSPSAGTLGFTCDANADTENSKSATVRLTYTYNTSETVTKDVTITQKKGGVIVLTPISSTKTWNVANNFAPLATTKGTEVITETFIDDNLEYYGAASGGKIQFNASYLRFGGSGSDSANCVTFKIAGPGTVSVNVKSAKSTEDRTIGVSHNSTALGTKTAPKGNDGATNQEWTINTASSGDLIHIYAGGSGINVYSITWTPQP